MSRGSVNCKSFPSGGWIPKSVGLLFAAHRTLMGAASYPTRGAPGSIQHPCWLVLQAVPPPLRLWSGPERYHGPMRTTLGEICLNQNFCFIFSPTRGVVRLCWLGCNSLPPASRSPAVCDFSAHVNKDFRVHVPEFIFLWGPINILKCL